MKIKIVFKNNTSIEGEVNCLDNLEIKCPDNSFYTLVNKSEILYIKVFNTDKEEDPLYEDAKKEANKAIEKSKEIKLSIRENLFDFIDDTGPTSNKVVNNIVPPLSEVITNIVPPQFDNKEIEEVNYGFPNFSALKISKQYSNKKTRNKNTRDKK